MLERINIILGISLKVILLWGFLSLFNATKVIKIDNLINDSLYQDNQDFSNFTTKYKILAIYYPQNVINPTYFDNKIAKKPKVEKDDEFNYRKSLIEDQVKLARSHGIFGFGIVYNWMNSLKFNEEILNLFSYDHMNNFPFFLLISDDLNFVQQNKSFLNKKLDFFISRLWLF